MLFFLLKLHGNRNLRKRSVNFYMIFFTWHCQKKLILEAEFLKSTLNIRGSFCLLVYELMTLKVYNFKEDKNEMLNFYFNMK